MISRVQDGDYAGEEVGEAKSPEYCSKVSENDPICKDGMVRRFFHASKCVR